MTTIMDKQAAREEYQNHTGVIWYARKEDYSVMAWSVDKEALAPFSDLTVIEQGHKVGISKGRQHPKHLRVFMDVRPDTTYRLPGEAPAKKKAQGGTAIKEHTEYLYSYYDGGDQGDKFIHAWRVVKTTPQFVFVKSSYCGHWTPEAGVLDTHGKFADRRPDWRIPRAELESKGEWFTGSLYYGDLYKDPQALWNRYMIRGLPDCVKALGITDPKFTAKQVTAAYRTLAKQLHPDQGGDTVAFIQLQKDYEQALQLAKG